MSKLMSFCCSGLLLIILLIRRRDRVPLKFMGHDLKQFKSLEGFLESGPQFVLQSYILMVGHKRNTNIDFNNIRKEDATRLAILSLSILVSFISLVKTAVQVNVPDPDERRKDKQHKENVPHYKLSLIVFTFFCVLYRLLRYVLIQLQTVSLTCHIPVSRSSVSI